MQYLVRGSCLSPFASVVTSFTTRILRRNQIRFLITKNDATRHRSLKAKIRIKALVLGAALCLMPLVGSSDTQTPARPGPEPRVIDSSDLKSVDGFRAGLFLTEDPEVAQKWSQPTTPDLVWTRRANRGLPLHTVLVFAGPAIDAQGQANVTCDLIIRDPKGNIYGEAKNATCFSGVSAAPPNVLQLAEATLTIVIEPNDPAGTYAVEVTVFDNVRKKQLSLVEKFVVED